MRVLGPNNVGRAVLTDTSAITEQKNCWELLAQTFDWSQTLCTNTQQHATGCANGRNMYHSTMFGVGQQCCVLLYGAKSDECGEVEMDSCTKWRFLVNTTKVFFSFSTGFRSL